MMTRAELSEMIALAQRLAAVDEPAVLSTLFSSDGSTYRRLGSMMVSGPATSIAGGVSGGCLEQYIARNGRELIRQQSAAVLSFGADPDGADDGKPVLGCGGSIEVLIERLTPDHLAFLRQLKCASEADAFTTAACVIDNPAGSPMSAHRLWLSDNPDNRGDPRLARLRQRSIAQERSLHGVLDSSRRALVHYIPSMTRLVIFGAGDDARPLCALARSLGWHVTVVDRRGRLATRWRFPEADQVLATDWTAATAAITFTPMTAVALMTHSLDDDTEILPLLAAKPMTYVGSLGPEHRRRWLLEVLENSTDSGAALVSRLRGPIGLDLGDRSATGIAVSIVSEILAELNGRSGLPLSQPGHEASIAQESQAGVPDV